MRQNQMKGDPDEALVKEFKAGSEQAFDRLYHKYRVSVYSICYRYVQNDADAQELCLDVFTKVFNNLRKFHEKSKLFTWIYRITVNTCISFKRKFRPYYVDHEPIDHEIPLEKRVTMKVAIDRALHTLPKRQQLCFILHHFEGYTFNEIGDIMRISTGAAKAHHHHAVKKLRVLLEEWL